MQQLQKKKKRNKNQEHIENEDNTGEPKNSWTSREI